MSQGKWIEYTKEEVRRNLPPRVSSSHKGTYGTVLIAAGSPGMMGAAVFAAKAAYRSGVGLVKVLIPENQSMVMTLAVPEAVQLLYHNDEDLAELVLPDGIRSIVLGPGMGNHRALFEKVMSLPEEIPMVLDADGLNQQAMAPIPRKNVIMTPHMGEASRLLHCSLPSIVLDPEAAALQLSNRYQAVVVLKNVPTRVVEYEGRCGKCFVGNPGMSTAGSGDVLAGTIGGLLAQNPSKGSLDLWTAAMCGVWLHGLAGDAAASSLGQYALMASDILQYLRPDQLVS